ALEMDVGGVEHAQGPSCRGHDQQHATLSVHNAAMTPSVKTPEDWLRTFEAAVRGRDFAGGRELFATDAMAFGTWARAVAGLDNIVREQWQNVWPRIREFHFEPDVRVHASRDRAWIAGGWRSWSPAPAARPVTRPGRGSFVLQRRPGKWLAVPSHFSLLP